MPAQREVTRFDRLELKYGLDARQRQALEAVVRARLQPDPYGDADGRYPIVSLYLDDAGLSAYWERERGLASRRKLRARIYGGAGTRAAPTCFVEVKHKYGRRTAKRRIALPVDEAMALVRGEPPPASATPLSAREALVAAEARAMVRDGRLEPRLVLRYTRHAFLGAVDAPDLRITFDSDIRARARDLVLRPDDDDFDVALLGAGASVLEIKVDHVVPLWLAEAVGRLGPLGAATSKYSLAAQQLLVPSFLSRQRAAPAAASAHARNGRTPHGRVQPALR